MFDALPGIGGIKSLLFVAVLSTVPVATGQSVQHYERCPTISVECPNDSVAGKPLVFRARVSNEEDPDLRFEWAVNNGTIVSGQGTTEITVSGDATNTITATFQVYGLDPSCSSTASCSLVVCRVPVAYLFDKYRWTPTEPVAKVQPAQAAKQRRNRTINRGKRPQ